jgi:TrmH family RNA methyltransferase
MLRSAAAAGATLAVLSHDCHDPWSPKALRGGQGAQFVLPLAVEADLAGWLAGFAGASVGLALAGSVPLYQLDFSGPCALVVGNEGAGLAPETLAAVTARARIPMPGRVESLNAAAALAVAAFEALRQRTAASIQRS